MKILIVFIDMLGAEYLHTFNNNAPCSGIDSLLEKIGGTAYTRCYTPAPDTPRSSGVMWSGLYPKENGCDNRLKYPLFYMRDGITNLWSYLHDNQYTINVYDRITSSRIGLINKEGADFAFDGTLDEFFKNVVICDNSVTFFYLPDLHLILDKYLHTTTGLKKGLEFVTQLLHEILERYDINQFDYTLFLSDHGFRLNDSKTYEHMIDYDRVRTFMFLHKKDDVDIIYDNELRSNLDVFPTIKHIISGEIDSRMDGKSLLGPGHEYILLEDHDKFSPDIGQAIEHWAVIDKNGLHWIDCDKIWKHALSDREFDANIYENLLIQKMNQFNENTQLYNVKHMYDNNILYNNYLSDGTKIHNRFKWIRRKIIAVKKAIRI